jgi:predicted secreted Zn-dependent protease
MALSLVKRTHSFAFIFYQGVTANAVHISLIRFMLKREATRSTETSVLKDPHCTTWQKTVLFKRTGEI